MLCVKTGDQNVNWKLYKGENSPLFVFVLVVCGRFYDTIIAFKTQLRLGSFKIMGEEKKGETKRQGENNLE